MFALFLLDLIFTSKKISSFLKKMAVVSLAFFYFHNKTQIKNNFNYLLLSNFDYFEFFVLNFFRLSEKDTQYNICKFKKI